MKARSPYLFPIVIFVGPIVSNTSLLIFYIVMCYFSFLKLLKNEIVLFRYFGSKFLHSKWKGVYKRAIVSALEVGFVISPLVHEENTTESIGVYVEQIQGFNAISSSKRSNTSYIMPKFFLDCFSRYLFCSFVILFVLQL